MNRTGAASLAVRLAIVRRGRATATCSAAVAAITTALAAGACRSTATPPDASASLGDDASSSAADAPSVLLPSLTIDNRGPGQFVLRAMSAVKVATLAAIEHRSDNGQWVAYDDLEGGNGFRLLDGCSEADVPLCRVLDAGSVFVPEPFSGHSCSAQCNEPCDKNVYRPGIHRLVVSACSDTKSRFEGLPFEVPSTEMMLARQRAASDVVRATVVRLDPRGAKDAAGSRAADRRAGFAVVAGTEKELEVDGRSELIKWLRLKEGFKDTSTSTKKQCVRQHMVGLALTASAAPGKETTAEIALDFGCNAMTVVHEQGGRRVTTASFFDASRSVILGIASRGIPTDAELAGLQ